MFTEFWLWLTTWLAGGDQPAPISGSGHIS